MKNGPVFMTHGVHPLPTSPSLVDIRVRVRQLSCFTECRRDRIRIFELIRIRIRISVVSVRKCCGLSRKSGIESRIAFG